MAYIRIPCQICLQL